MEKDIVHLFLTTEDNTAPAIAKKLGAKTTYVCQIIRRYLNAKYGKE